MKLSHKTLKIFLVSFGLAMSVRAQSVDYKAQVLFMYNFIKYTEWPSHEEKFSIVVFGDSPITGELAKLASIKKTPEGKPIIVTQTHDINNLFGCQMIYITDSESKEAQEIANFMRDKPVLIIAQRDGLVKKGAGISFFTNDDDRLGFAINLKNVESRKIKVAGELLHLAEISN
jgi:hypothetical protein